MAIVAIVAVITWIRNPATVSAQMSRPVKEAIDTMNSRGANILLLAGMAIYFFHSAMNLFYVVMDKIQAGTLTADNAIALMGLQFATSSAFGGFAGALLTMMVGGESKPLPPVVPPTVTQSLTFSGSSNEAGTSPIV